MPPMPASTVWVCHPHVERALVATPNHRHGAVMGSHLACQVLLLRNSLSRCPLTLALFNV